MRTTLTIDPDVAALLARVQKKRNLTLKAAVNEALRQGLTVMTTPQIAPAASYKVRTYDLGRCKIGNLDDISDALAIAEGESFS